MHDYWDDPDAYYRGESSGLPFAYTVGTTSGACLYAAVARRRYCYVSVKAISTCRDVEVEIWGKGRIIYDCPSQADPACTGKYVFSENGDGAGLQWGKWSKITTTSLISDTGSTKKYKIGNAAFPIPDDPPNIDFLSSPCSSVKGYEMIDAKAILKWTFEYA